MVLVGGGKLIVDSGVEVAYLLSIPPFLIGMTAVAVGTSLPELAVSITGLAAKEEKLVVGNILGSNIYNILFGGGILGVFNSGGLNNFPSLIFFLIFSFLFCLLIYTYKGRPVSRYFGFIIFVLYVVYLWLIKF